MKEILGYSLKSEDSWDVFVWTLKKYDSYMNNEYEIEFHW